MNECKWLKDGNSNVCNPDKAPFESRKFLLGKWIDVNGHLFIDILSHVARKLRLKLVVISNEKNYVTMQSNRHALLLRDLPSVKFCISIMCQWHNELQKLELSTECNSKSIFHRKKVEKLRFLILAPTCCDEVRKFQFNVNTSVASLNQLSW